MKKETRVKFEALPVLVRTSALRKIDQDKELKDIAKPILEKWDLLPYGKCDPNVLSAMIEAMKRVKK